MQCFQDRFDVLCFDMLEECTYFSKKKKNAEEEKITVKQLTVTCFARIPKRTVFARLASKSVSNWKDWLVSQVSKQLDFNFLSTTEPSQGKASTRQVAANLV